MNVRKAKGQSSILQLYRVRKFKFFPVYLLSRDKFQLYFIEVLIQSLSENKRPFTSAIYF